MLFLCFSIHRPYYAAVGLAGTHLAWQIRTVNLNNADDCGAKFRSNQHVGALVFGGVVCGMLCAAGAPSTDQTSPSEGAGTGAGASAEAKS